MADDVVRDEFFDQLERINGLNPQGTLSRPQEPVQAAAQRKGSVLWPSFIHKQVSASLREEHPMVIGIGTIVFILFVILLLRAIA